MLEKYGLILKKFMFPVMLIAFGIILIKKGLEVDPATNIKQTSDFLLGAYAILGAGVVSLLYTLDLINKYVNIAVILLLFALTAFFAVKSVKSIKKTIAQREAKERWDNITKQALSDIRDVQVEYKKKHGFYASDYNELKRFLKEDKVMDVIIKGDIPDRRITEEEGKKLGYDKLKDEEKYNDIDEMEAYLLGIIEIDTLWYPVMEVMYTGEQAQKKNEGRLYEFSIEELGKVPADKLPKIKGHDVEGLEYPMYTDTVRVEDELVAHLYLYDPKPYDPFVKRDTLKLGSKTEPKTTGSWAEK